MAERENLLTANFVSKLYHWTDNCARLYQCVYSLLFSFSTKQKLLEILDSNDQFYLIDSSSNDA